MKNLNTRDIALNAILGALYIALVWVSIYSSFETIQFRIAEALLVLLIFNIRLVPGLAMGTFIANLIFSPFGIVDALVGTLASLVAIILMVVFRKTKILTFIFPPLANGIIVGLMISYLSQTPFWIEFSFVFLGEFIVMFTLGLVLYYTINKNKALKEIITNENYK